MRTTIDLRDDLLTQLKGVAIASKCTLTQVIQDAVRESLARRKHRPSARCELPVFGDGGVQPGVDLDDTSALVDVMDDRADSRR
jgi:hypothetical protein